MGAQFSLTSGKGCAGGRGIAVRQFAILLSGCDESWGGLVPGELFLHLFEVLAHATCRFERGNGGRLPAYARFLLRLDFPLVLGCQFRART